MQLSDLQEDRYVGLKANMITYEPNVYLDITLSKTHGTALGWDTHTYISQYK